MKKNTLSLLFLISIVIADYLYEYYFYFAKYNQTPLIIKTFDGSGQPYHPSVVFVDKGWNGHRYWMAQTPYPIGAEPYRDRWECPQIHVSDDGELWKSPVPGKLIPIDDLTEEEIQRKDYFSDPHLVLRGDSVLECFYRLTNKTDSCTRTCLLKKTSTDGISWSKRELLIDLTSEKAINSVGNMVRSPAVLFENEQYLMWYVDGIKPFEPNKHILLSTSSDGYEWGKSIQCILNGPDINPWHIDVAHIGTEYQMTIYDQKNLTLWVSNDGKHFTYSRLLLSPVGVRGSFYSEGLYRSSLIKDDKNFKLYFSAYDVKNTYLGLMEGNSVEELETISPINRKNARVKLSAFPRTYLSIWKRRIHRIFNRG